MRKLLFLTTALLLTVISTFAKTVYIPTQFSSAPWNEWSPGNKYETANFVIFWGAKVGANPATYSDPNLRFDPVVLGNYFEASYNYYVNTVQFHNNSGKLGLYKMIVVMNETYNGAGGPTGWAFGGAYDEMIGALWIHPNATRDPYVIAHEIAHSFQSQNRIDFKPGGNQGGFNNYEPAGYFWESHANFMRAMQYPALASDDMPRWLMSRHFFLGSTRHHYSSFKWLSNMQQNFGGVNTVNRLWKESIANEVPTETWRRISGWTQAQLNDGMYDYAKREVNFDYPALGFGADMRDQINVYKTTAAENHWLWRQHTILKQISATTGRYIVPNNMAPQDYGMNIIPLHPSCTTNTVHVKFRGHTEVNTAAGWRWGFVEVLSNGTSCVYSPMQSSSNGEASYTLTNASSKLFLVVSGAPTVKHDYVWEPGWPKIHRYPYELRIENALPEGYQSNFRADVKTLFPGHTHSNGGGWVANTATVASTVYVGPKAVVLGSSNLSGSVQVNETARLENVTASNSVVFSGDCNVYAGSYSGTAQIKDGAVLFDVNVSGNAVIKDNAWAWGVTFGTGLTVGGDAEIGSCAVAGTYLQVPHPNNNRNACDGKGASDASNVDVNAAYSNFTDTQMAWTAIGCSGSGPTPGNIAPLATPTTSYVSPWETLSAVNDGFTPANSNDHTHGAYGNWNNPNTIEWVQYDWPQNYWMTSVELYWFDDAGGVLTPTTAYLEYWNAATSAWVNIGNIPLVKNANNVLNIGTVQCSRLRVSMRNTTQSTGIIEWRVIGSLNQPSGSSIDVNSARLNVLPDESNKKEGIDVFPNPAQSTFRVDVNGYKPSDEVTMKIYDLQGKALLTKELRTTRTVMLNTSSFTTNGSMFILTTTNGSKTFTKKLIVVK